MFGNFRQDKGWVVRKDGWLGASYFCIFFFFFFFTFGFIWGAAGVGIVLLD